MNTRSNQVIHEAWKSTFGNTPVLLRIIVLNFGLILPAMIVSWSSPCLAKLDGTKDPQNNPLPAPITTVEKSRLASAPMISATLTCFLPTLLLRNIRRKYSYILLILPNIIGLVILCFGFNYWMLYAGRLICGVTYTSVIQIVPRYSAELSSPQHRGALGCLMAIFITMGHLLSYSVGNFVSFATFNQLSLIPSAVLFFLLLFYVDESPFDLISTKPEKARKILRKLRGRSSDVELENELEAIRLFALGIHHFNLREFCTSKALRKSLLICILLIMFTNLTGLNVILAYMQEIFTEAKVPSPELASIYVGITQFLSTFCPPFLIDRMGRKALLAITHSGILLCLCVFATYNTLLERKFDLDWFRWVPMVSLFFITAFFYNGVGLVPFILMGEVFHPNYKNISATASIFCQTFSILLMTWGYPLLVESIQLAYTFWLYATFTLLGLLYIIVFVPETKQKTFEEIQRIMET